MISSTWGDSWREDHRKISIRLLYFNEKISRAFTRMKNNSRLAFTIIIIIGWTLSGEVQILTGQK